MSDELQPNVPAVEPTGVEPSGDADWDAAIAEAGPTAEPVATPETPVVSQTPEAPASEAPVAAEPTDYTYHKLENGDHEMRLASGEVYRGKSELELAQNVAKGKIEANRYIQTLKATPPPASVAEAPKPAEPVLDPTAQVIADFAAQGYGFKNSAELTQFIQGIKAQTEQFNGVHQQMQAQQEALTFVKTTPEFVNTPANAERIDTWLTERNLPFNARTAQDAFYALKGQGLLEAAKPVARTENGQFAKTNPLPPSGNAPSGTTGKGEMTVADLEAMEPEALLALMEGAAA